MIARRKSLSTGANSCRVKVPPNDASNKIDGLSVEIRMMGQLSFLKASKVAGGLSNPHRIGHKANLMPPWDSWTPGFDGAIVWSGGGGRRVPIFSSISGEHQPNYNFVSRHPSKRIFSFHR